MDARPRDADEPQDDASTEDARWRELVARLEGMGPVETVDPRDAPDDAGTLPDRGRPAGAAPAGPAGEPDGWPAGPRHGTPDAAAAGPPPSSPRGWLPDPAVEEAEDHFHPPDPGPVLAGEPLLVLAWGGVLAFPVVLLLVAVLWTDAPAVVLQVAGAVFVVGLALLLWRMPRGDDDRGSGAVV